MANQPQNLDKLFEEKLSQHQVKPSKLAWERLESQLPKKQKPERKFYWWAAAAAILVLIVSYSVFQTSEQTSQPEFVAETTHTEEIIPQEDSPSQTTINDEAQQEEEPKEAQANINEPVESKKSDPLPSKKEIRPNQFTAMNEKVGDEKEKATEIEIPEIVLPEIGIDRTLIAEAEIESPLEKDLATAQSNEIVIQEPVYKVTIISDGIKSEKDKNLIAGIGKRVNQVEGLLGKVDEGFGELQDAKNNLFASLISKKERTTEKP